MKEHVADNVIVVEPWATDIGLFIGYDDFNEWVTGHGGECPHINGMHAAYAGLVDDGCEYWALYLPKGVRLESVFHEALHLAWALLNRHGVKVTRRNDELLTYFQGYIVRLVVGQVDHLKTFRKLICG